MEREVKASARLAQRCSVDVELSGIAFTFAIQEAFDVCPLVAAGLEVDHPAYAVGGPEDPIHNEGANSRNRSHAHTKLAARFRVLAENPAPAVVCERSGQSSQDHFGGALNLSVWNTSAPKLLGELRQQ